MSEKRPLPIPPPLIALAGWALPGLGYLLIGQRARGLTIGVTILSLYVMGLLIGGMKVVDQPSFTDASGFNGHFHALFQKPWYVAQILAGPVTLLAANIGVGEGYATSHARINEIGILYTAVAGMLNLLGIIDCSYRAGQIQPAVRP